ncbi:ArdC-like ssDNA-binding domain-containing protein [Leuconostocaceae bacterium ESL0958]|nr:ArdC-like ssDNA-binding domain-containing protein [Leuconostocaceae bacterium ESL0958]
MKIKLISSDFLKKERERTGSKQFLAKSTRPYLGLYDEKNDWFIPLVAKLREQSPHGSSFPTPVRGDNKHLKDPGLNFEKAIFVGASHTIDLPPGIVHPTQITFIQSHQTDIQIAFQAYLKRLINQSVHSNAVKFTTIKYYPEGIKRILNGPNYAEQIDQLCAQEFKKEQKMPEQNLSDILKAKDSHGLDEHIKAGMKDYLDSDKFKEFLNFVSKFPTYSFSNQYLIAQQNPDATHVAGYKKWQDLGSPVKKGEKSLKIRAPYTYVKKDQNGEPKRNTNTGEIEKGVGFRFVSVFDIKQTQSPEKLPQQVQDIQGDLSQKDYSLAAYMEAFQKLTDAEIRIQKFNLESAKGVFLKDKNLIVVQPGLGEKATLKTTLHEVAHSRLHDQHHHQFGSSDYAKDEFEAEAIAYVVSNHLGIDTSEYSFGYLKSWENKVSTSEIQGSFDTIIKESNDLIQQVDQAMLHLNSEKTSTHDLFAEVRESNKQEKSAKKTENLTQRKGPSK